MSVQASAGHYCEPRITGLGFYNSYEIGYITQEEELLTPFAEDPENLTATIYGWVPVSVVAEVIAKHGGVVGTEQGEVSL